MDMVIKGRMPPGTAYRIRDATMLPRFQGQAAQRRGRREADQAAKVDLGQPHPVAQPAGQRDYG